MSPLDELQCVFARNKNLIGIVALVFFLTLFLSIVVSYLLFATSPLLVTYLKNFIASQRAVIGNVSPRTSAFYWLIFLNNIGHFWNPVRIWVWIPFVGALSLGYELVLNAVIIGAVASYAALTKGVGFTIAGLAPHGVLELPAFVLEFAALTRWHITTTRALYGKLSGRQIDRAKFKEGVKDTVILSIISVALFAVAAYIETYITPLLIGS